MGVGAFAGPDTSAESPNFEPTTPDEGLWVVVTVEVGLFPKSLPVELTLFALTVTECWQPPPVPG